MKPRFPSLQDIGRACLGVAQRFAPVVIAAWTGAVTALLWINQPAPEPPEATARFRSGLMACALAVPLLLALSLYGERLRRFGVRVLLLGAGAALSFGFYLALRTAEIPTPEKWIERFFILWAGAHFLVAIAPFMGRRGSAGFWRLNEIFFLRFLLGALYTGILYIGLALALLSLHKLLGADIQDKTYGRLWVILAGGFHPVFFLAGVPRDLEGLEQPQAHPIGLRRFVQFVLFPLVAVYLAILYVYAAKIAVVRHLPNGWLSWPVLILSVIGILACLLNQPIEDDPAFRWAGAFRRWFYRLLLLLTPLLLLALGRRIHDYGLTEGRCLGVILAVWLGATSALFGRTRPPSIKWIPASLSVLSVLSVLGPWNAFALSYRSQWAKLTGQLQAAGVLRDGRAVAGSAKPITKDTRRRIASEVEYLLRVQGRAVLDPLMENIPAWSSHDHGRRGAFGLYGAGNEFLGDLGIPSEFSTWHFLSVSLASSAIVAVPPGGQVSRHVANQAAADSFVGAISTDGKVTLDASGGPARVMLRAGSQSAVIDLAAKIAALERRRSPAAGATGQSFHQYSGADLSWNWMIDHRRVTIVVLQASGTDNTGGIPPLQSVEFLTIVSPATP